MTLPPFAIILVLLIVVLVSIVPPRLPLAARIGIHVVIGLVIYFGMGKVQFALPNGDNLPLSGLYGGRGFPFMPAFNKLALGFIAPVLGIVLSLIVAGIRKVVSKGDSD
jgi:hypothetical protein